MRRLNRPFWAALIQFRPPEKPIYQDDAPLASLVISDPDGGFMEPILLARDVQKAFGSGQRRTPILRGVSLEVSRGEIVFLVGPSGSGKTTLLSLLGCLLSADGGSIEVLGQNITEMGPGELTALRRRSLGFVFQTFNLFPNLSAMDNVRLSLCMRGVASRAATSRSREALEQVGLGSRARLRPSQLSTGECQRVALARALVGEPALLFADEPTASLDAQNGQAVMDLLHRLVQDRGVTLVIVTHDNRILHFADRILSLEDGRLVGEESPVLAEVPSADAMAAVARMRLRKEYVA